jgi:predicted signal transduction protein with EAL and GGDEF domain
VATYLACHDESADLPTPGALADALVPNRTVPREPGRTRPWGFTDLDGFEAVDHLAGHDQGEEVPAVIAAPLQAVVRGERCRSPLSRTAGDGRPVPRRRPDGQKLAFGTPIPGST